MTPSPMMEDNQRVTKPTPASPTATMAMRTASQITVPTPALAMMASTTWPARTGVATARKAPAMEATTKAMSLPLCGAAKAMTRFRVSLEKGFEPLLAVVMLYSELQATRSMLMVTSPG
ncbi:hypothetical protein D3C73_1226890 [compost metagenome]